MRRGSTCAGWPGGAVGWNPTERSLRRGCGGVAGGSAVHPKHDAIDAQKAAHASKTADKIGTSAVTPSPEPVVGGSAVAPTPPATPARSLAPPRCASLRARRFLRFRSRRFSLRLSLRCASSRARRFLSFRRRRFSLRSSRRSRSRSSVVAFLCMEVGCSALCPVWRNLMLRLA